MLQRTTSGFLRLRPQKTRRPTAGSRRDPLGAHPEAIEDNAHGQLAEAVGDVVRAQQETKRLSANAKAGGERIMCNGQIDAINVADQHTPAASSAAMRQRRLPALVRGAASCPEPFMLANAPPADREQSRCCERSYHPRTNQQSARMALWRPEECVLTVIPAGLVTMDRSSILKTAVNRNPSSVSVAAGVELGQGPVGLGRPQARGKRSVLEDDGIAALSI